MRSIALIISLAAALITPAQAETVDSAAEYIRDAYQEKVDAWSQRADTDVAPVWFLRYNFAGIQNAAIAADDGVYGPASNYAIAFNERIVDDLTAWQNSGVATATLVEWVPRMEKHIQAIQTQLDVWSDTLGE